MLTAAMQRSRRSVYVAVHNIEIMQTAAFISVHSSMSINSALVYALPVTLHTCCGGVRCVVDTGRMKLIEVRAKTARKNQL
jgi:hypothetical protein